MSSLIVISKSFYLKSNKARSETIKFFLQYAVPNSQNQCAVTHTKQQVSVYYILNPFSWWPVFPRMFVIAVKLCLCDCWWKETDKEAMLALKSNFRLMHIASSLSYRSYVIRRGECFKLFLLVCICVCMWKVKELLSMELWFLSFYSCCCFY